MHVCTNEPRDPFIRYFERRYGATVRPGGFQGARIDASYLSGAMDNFLFIKRFNKIVISNSSFAWWAAFLSDAELIIGPRPASGMWAPSDPISKNLDLEVKDGRFRYLECEPYRSEFLLERLSVSSNAAKRRARAGIRRFLPSALFRSGTTRAASAHRFHEDLDE